MSYSLTDQDILFLRNLLDDDPEDGYLYALVGRIDDCNQPIPDDNKHKDIGFTMKAVGKGRTIQEAWDDMIDAYHVEEDDPEECDPEFLGYDEMEVDDND